MTQATVSVILPVYNGMPYLPAALHSITHQTCGDLDVIVVDDESTDSSLSWLRKQAADDRRIVLVESKHRGVTGALNEGLRRARGEFIARMDADDVAHPARIAEQLDFLRRYPEVVAVGCWVRRIDEDGDLIAIGHWPETHAEILRGLLRAPEAFRIRAQMRRAVVEKIGGYREHFRLAQDKDLWLRLAEHGQLANLPRVLLDYREHRRSLSRSQRLRQRQQLCAVLDEAWQRRGGGGASDTRRPRLPRGRVTRHAELDWLRSARRAKNWPTARKYAIRSLHCHPTVPATWWEVSRWLVAASAARCFAVLASLRSWFGSQICAKR